MNRNRCECEIEVTEALRTRVWTSELQEHMVVCAVCREMRRVAGSLLQYASMLQVESEAGTVNNANVDAIWRRAQAQRQAMALKRATRPLIFMRGVSVSCVVAFAGWFLMSLSRMDYRGWVHGWARAGVETAAAGLGIAVVGIGVGAFYMLREDKRRDVLEGIS